MNQVAAAKINVGTRIKAIEGCGQFYSAGDCGEVVRLERSSLWVRFESSGEEWNIAKRFAAVCADGAA